MTATCRFRRATAAAAPLTATDYRLYVLAGQSNMEGYGTVAELPDSLLGIREAVWIFHGTRQADGEKPRGLGQWSPLLPGHGAGYSATVDSLRYGTYFGPELGFAARLREWRPKTPIALIKYAKDGTGIDSAALVTHTDRYAYSAPWHDDTAGFIDLGFRMAEAMAELEARCGAGSSGPGARDE